MKDLINDLTDYRFQNFDFEFEIWNCDIPCSSKIGHRKPGKIDNSKVI